MNLHHCTEVRFDALLSSGFTTMAVINPPERKLAKRTSVHCVILVLLKQTKLIIVEVGFDVIGLIWGKFVKY